MTCFVKYPQDTHFPIENLPYGVFSTKDKDKRIGIRIGDYVLDLKVISLEKLSNDSRIQKAFSSDTLNYLLECAPEVWTLSRQFIKTLLATDSPIAKNSSNYLVPIEQVTMHLPISIGDYTDFYSSYQHVYNCGVLIRGKDNAIQPNWPWLPVAYHGRASSVVVSGTPIHRPQGQRKVLPTDSKPQFGPSIRLDYELEFGFIVGGKLNEIGHNIPVNEAKNNIFGCVIVNDWSARDIQTWEYVPLGPFLGKSFATSISPWVVTLEAMNEFAIDAEKQDPQVLSYLEQNERKVYDMELQVDIKGKDSEMFTTISQTNLKYLYWTFEQQLAHHTINGCPMRAGDLLATGTISGETPESYGSLLERTQAGKVSYELKGVSEPRTWLIDGDVVRMTAVGHSRKGNYNIGFGCVEGVILPCVNSNSK